MTNKKDRHAGKGNGEGKRKTQRKINGGHSSVLFVTATPQSVLRNQIQEEIDKTQFKIKVIEKSGRKLIRHLQRNDPFKKKECRRKDECMICTGSGQCACRGPGVSVQNKLFRYNTRISGRSRKVQV